MLKNIIEKLRNYKHTLLNDRLRRAKNRARGSKFFLDKFFNKYRFYRTLKSLFFLQLILYSELKKKFRKNLFLTKRFILSFFINSFYVPLKSTFNFKSIFIERLFFRLVYKRKNGYDYVSACKGYSLNFNRSRKRLILRIFKRIDDIDLSYFHLLFDEKAAEYIFNVVQSEAKHCKMAFFAENYSDKRFCYFFGFNRKKRSFIFFFNIIIVLVVVLFILKYGFF